MVGKAKQISYDGQHGGAFERMQAVQVDNSCMPFHLVDLWGELRGVPVIEGKLLVNRNLPFRPLLSQ